MATKVVKRKNKTKGRWVPLKNLHARVGEVEKALTLNAIPEFKAGDTIRVQVRIVEGDKERLQAFEGVCIRRNNRGMTKSFTVRKIASGVGVERIFLENSPKVGQIELVSTGKIKRAKLYYLRGLEGRAAKIEREIDGPESTAPAAPRA